MSITYLDDTPSKGITYLDNASPQEHTLLPQMTDDEKMRNPVLAGVDQTANDIATLGYKAANGLSLGILGNILKSKNIQEPNFNNSAPENKSGLNLIGDIFGLSAANKTIGAGIGKLGDVSNATGIPKAVGNASSQVWNNIKQAIVLNKTLPKSTSLADSMERLNIQKDNLNTASQLLSNTNSMKIRGILDNVKQLNSFMNDSIKDVASKISDQSKELSGTLKEEIGNKVSSTQQIVPNFFKNASSAYGETLDHVIDSVNSPIVKDGLLSKNAAPATRQEIFDKLSGLVDNESDPIITNSLPFKKIQLLKEKYNPETVTSSGILGSNGNPIITNTGNESIDLKQLLGEMRDLNSSVRSGVKSGSSAISPEDLMVSRFNHSIGDLVKDRVPAFKSLQESYAPVMKAKELAYKIFKPNKGDFATNSAEAFFKRVAFKDKTSGQDQALLDMLENGTQVAGTPQGIAVNGIGDISSNLRSIGNKISSLSDNKLLGQQAVKDGLSLNINGLQSQVKMLKDSQNMFNINKIQRINDLDSRLSTIDKALKARKQIDDLKKKVALGASGLAGAGFIGKLGIHALSQSNNN